MTHTEFTPESISALQFEDATDDTVKKLIEITDNNPDDLLRGFARSWLSINAIKLLKRKY